MQLKSTLSSIYSKNKKPRERKKSVDSSNASLNNSKKDKNTHQTKDSVALATTTGTTMTAVNAVNAITTAATSITTNINNNNTVNILQSTSPPKSIISSTSNTSTLIANTSKTDSHSLPLNFGSSSLTITAVDTTDMTTSKPLPSVPNKVTITNIDTSASASSAPLQRNITSPSVSIHATNGGHSIYNSPTKLASDHSIHHLISSPQIIHSTDSESSPVQLTTSRNFSDSIGKPIAAVLSKAAELKKITAVKTSGKETPIQITSVQSMATIGSAAKSQRSDTIDINDSTSDDDVEIVEAPTVQLLREVKLIGSPSERNDRPKCVTVNKLKYKSAMESAIRSNNSRSDSPKTMGTIKAEATAKDNDVDVIQIMKQLKELQVIINALCKQKKSYSITICLCARFTLCRPLSLRLHSYLRVFN